MEKKLYLTKAAPENLDAAMEIINRGKRYLKRQGIDQWQTGYPAVADISRDIARGKGWFVTDGDSLLAYMCIDFDSEEAYNNINGRWLTDTDNYIVVHRLAMSDAGRGKGLSSRALRLAEEAGRGGGAVSVRVDTDPANTIMQKVIAKAGFTLCGSIWFDGGDKTAFEKLIK